jgi:hypothetical protein
MLSLILAFFSDFQTVKANGELALTGKVHSIEIEDKEDSVLVSVRLVMSLKAVGDKPILLWKQIHPDPILSGAFLCINAKILGSVAAEKEEKILHYSNCALPSIQRTPAWQDIMNKLDNKIPPLDHVQIINRGEHFDFNADWKFIFLKKKALNSNDPLWGRGSDYDVIWDEIKDARNLSLRLTYRTWSFELERGCDNPNKRKFGKKLQKRWKAYGNLWLDDITSEPIALRLN